MVALPVPVQNTADLPDGGGALPLIPPGQYQAVIVKSDLVDNNKKTGKILELTNVITQGQFQGTEFIERLNLVNPSVQAVEIATRTLARIAEAVGMNQTPSDSLQLHNKPFFIEVATEAGTEYIDKQGQKKMGKDKSIIKKYIPVPGNGAGAGVSNVHDAPFPPVQTAGQPTNAAPAHNPFAAKQ